MNRTAVKNLGFCAAAIGVFGFAPSAEAAAPPVRQLVAETYTIDKGNCRNGYFSVYFNAPLRNVVEFDLEVRTSRGTITKTVHSYQNYVSITPGCVSKGFVQDVKRKKLTATVYAYTTSGAYAGKRSVKIKLIDSYNC
ncbi:hypothetical protein [Paractinoplanes lichenicola]|uniref:Uncharacterized protein n=1 Tax=Paractinoplanes lichenicola TaxID=2802976 RepID=A0ABS1VH36_9ACTN|nr:hypothetical protein [Actinoplanes lichenicola]MBL7254017.1 hypothetical protein [Actinoplanes lichenicola]